MKKEKIQNAKMTEAEKSKVERQNEKIKEGTVKGY